MGRQNEDTVVASSGVSKVPSKGMASDSEAFFDLVPAPNEAYGLDSRWLFRSEEGVFGPISAKELLELLYVGSISGETLIGEEQGEFREMRRYAVFQTHVERALEVERRRQKAEADAREVRRRERVRRLTWALRAGLAAVVCSMLMYAFVRGGRTVAAALEQAKLQRKVEAEVAQLLTIVRSEPPKLPRLRPVKGRRKSVASALLSTTRRPAEVSFPAEDNGRQVKINPSERSPNSSGRSQSVSGKRRGRAGKKRRGRSGQASDRKRLSDREVMTGMKRIFPQIARCIRGQLRRDGASVPKKVVLRFSISNQGRATNMQLADRFLRRSLLQPCLQELLKKVQWRPYKGQIRNIEYPISVNKPE
ncbi:MAG: hypothetical protein KTR25_17995 [Myxococcales bacterium]|nr:hypothetical protein [Myxococcales bacterium]